MTSPAFNPAEWGDLSSRHSVITEQLAVRSRKSNRTGLINATACSLVGSVPVTTGAGPAASPDDGEAEEEQQQQQQPIMVSEPLRVSAAVVASRQGGRNVGWGSCCPPMKSSMKCGLLVGVGGLVTGGLAVAWALKQRQLQKIEKAKRANEREANALDTDEVAQLKGSPSGIVDMATGRIRSISDYGGERHRGETSHRSRSHRRRRQQQQRRRSTSLSDSSSPSEIVVRRRSPSPGGKAERQREEESLSSGGDRQRHSDSKRRSTTLNKDRQSRRADDETSLVKITVRETDTNKVCQCDVHHDGTDPHHHHTIHRRYK